MKNALSGFLLSFALLASACTKENTPAPTVTTPPPTAPAGPTARASITVNGVVTAVTITSAAFGSVIDNGGTLIHRATFNVYLPSPAGAMAVVKYFLTSSVPLGTITFFAPDSFNGGPVPPISANAPAPTLTSRAITTAGFTSIYLSGSFTASLGPGYASALCTFTDVRASN